MISANKNSFLYNLLEIRNAQVFARLLGLTAASSVVDTAIHKSFRSSSIWNNNTNDTKQRNERHFEKS